MTVAPVYVEIHIRAPLEAVWDRTQRPDQHRRWDIRFSRLDYLPQAPGDAMQQFVFTTRIGFGVKIRGEGAFVIKRASDGSRTTALRFWSKDRWSVVRSGCGYWRYVPTHDGVIFCTGFDYDTRFGYFGATLDRCFRPLVSWATAWSFDRLRLWLESGIPPEVSRRWLLPRAQHCRRSRVAHPAGGGRLVAAQGQPLTRSARHSFSISEEAS